MVRRVLQRFVVGEYCERHINYTDYLFRKMKVYTDRGTDMGSQQVLC